MAKHLTDADRAFRELVANLDGDIRALADTLSISETAVKLRLKTLKHGSWWRAFKRQRSKRRHAARIARYRARCREDAARALGIPVTYR